MFYLQTLLHICTSTENVAIVATGQEVVAFNSFPFTVVLSIFCTMYLFIFFYFLQAALNIFEDECEI